MKTLLISAALVWIILLTPVADGFGQDRFHHRSSSPKVNYDSLFTAAVPLSESSIGSKLLEECLETYGGTGKLNELRDFELVYDVTSRFAKEHFTLVKSFQRGRRYKIRRPTEERVINGTSCWFSNADTVLALDGGRYKAELYSYLTLAMPLAMRTERFDAVRYGKRHDDPLDYIYLDKQDSLLVVVGIDPNDHLIRSVEGIIRQGEQSYVFINRFNESQRHGGFYFPGHVTTISMGLEVSSARLKEVKVNPGLDEDYFKPKFERVKRRNSGEFF